MSKNIYVVIEGRKPGIYFDWNKVWELTNEYSGAMHRGFYSWHELRSFLKKGYNYSRKQLLTDLQRCPNADIREQVLKGYERFVDREELGFPSELLSKSVLTPRIIEELGVDSEDDLEFINGAFKISGVVDLREFSKGFIDDKQGYVALRGNSRCDDTNKSIVETPENWYNQYFPTKSKEWLFHRGHMIAKSFQKYTRTRTVLHKINRGENIFISTNWLNHANHSMNNGVNQTYIENNILTIMKQNPQVRVNYMAKLLFEVDEIVPRGIHIMVEFEGQVKSFQKQSDFRTLNIFIPNVDPRFIVDYKRRS